MDGQIIDEIYNNSLEIYDALINNNKYIDKLYKSIKSNKSLDVEKITKLNKKELDKIISDYDKKKILFDVVNLIDKKFTHLKTVKDIVNLDNLIEFVITDKILLDKVKLVYTNKIIDLILEKYYDKEDIKVLSKKKEELIDIERKINANIIRNLNDYYIRLITI